MLCCTSLWPWDAYVECSDRKCITFVKGTLNSKHLLCSLAVELTNEFIQLLCVAELIYIIDVTIAKVSIFLQFIRIFIPNHRSTSFYLVQVLLWGNILVFSVFLLIRIFECAPISKIWEPIIPGTCISHSFVWVCITCICLVSDVLIMVLPITWVYHLQMPSQRKIIISAVFAIGTL